jgi:UDP-N-acetylmuramate dehydrogenase
MLVKAGINLVKGIKELKISGVVSPDESLKERVTLKIGGKAEVFIVPADSEDLGKIVRFTKENGISLFVLGGGSKVLIPDEELPGVVLSLDSPYFKKIEFCNGGVKLGSGVKVNNLLRNMQDKRIGGWEFLAGMPASIGGMIIMNAGIRDGDSGGRYIQIGDFVEEITVMDTRGDISVLKRGDIDFSYRHSGLTGYIILETKLSGALDKDRSIIASDIARFVEHRTKTQEISFPNAGCIFKNPAGDMPSSGALIELAGLKGKRIGDVVVSNKHANFILNIGNGKASDFLMLMDLIQGKVKLMHNIWLEPEIRIIGN